MKLLPCRTKLSQEEAPVRIEQSPTGQNQWTTVVASGGDRTYPLWGGGVASSAAGAYAGNSGAAGGGAAHFNVQPTTYVNVMIKL